MISNHSKFLEISRYRYSDLILTIRFSAFRTAFRTTLRTASCTTLRNLLKNIIFGNISKTIEYFFQIVGPTAEVLKTFLPIVKPSVVKTICIKNTVLKPFGQKLQSSQCSAFVKIFFVKMFLEKHLAFLVSSHGVPGVMRQLVLTN